MMRVRFVSGLLVGLCAVVSSAKEVRERAPSVKNQLARFRSGADDRQFDHGGVAFTRVIERAGQEFLGQSFEIDHNFFRAAVPIGGLDDLGSVASVQPAPLGYLRAASEWVTVERHDATRVEKQTLAVAFRKINELGRPSGERLTRVQREYQVIGLGAFVRVRATGTDEVEALEVQVGEVTGTFTPFGTMLGAILGFRATPTSLRIFTSANVEYQVRILVVDGQMTFNSGRPLGEAGELIRAQSEMTAAIARPATCRLALTDQATTPR